MDEHVAEAAQTPATLTAPARRRRLRRCGSVLAALPLLTGTFLGLPETASHAAPRTTASPATPSAASADASSTSTVSINRLTPSAPGKGDTVTISGQVGNTTGATVTDARVALRVGSRLTSRSSVEEVSSRPGVSPGIDGAEIDGKGTVELGDMPAGSSRSFTLTVPVGKLPLDEAGVYPIGVSLSGRTREQPYEHVLGVDRTFLPWQSSSPEAETRITFLWPLISTAHLGAHTEADDEDQTPVFDNDDLAEEIAPGGRLQQLVALGKDLPVTWVIDPDLLASVAAMTERYEVRIDDDTTVPGRGQEHARQWLFELQQAVEDEEVVALPFGDPDLASLAHRGKNVPGTLGHLGPATELGRKTVETELHVEPSTDFAWPVEGAIDPSIVSVATSAGAHNVITRSDSLRETGGLNHTPTAARPIGGGTTAIVADAKLSQLFQGDMTRARNSTRSVQRFLAHTQLITAQRPGTRSIVVAPQRRPTASQAQTMAAALRSLELDGRWMEFVPLSEAAEAEPDPRANRKVPSQSAYPSALRKQELRTEAFEEIRATQNTLEDFEEILSQPDRVRTPFNNAIRRSISTSWRGDRESAAEYREATHAYLEELTGGVRLIEKSDMKLSGRSATIPVTVQNNLFQSVEGLELRLTSGRRLGLDVGGPQPVTVKGGHSQSVKVPTTAKANGRTWVEAQLYTEDGEPWGEPMTFHVEVTEITSAVMLVISGGVLLVVLAGVRMYTQRKRAGARPDPDAPAAPEPSVEEDDEDDEGAGDAPRGGTGEDAGNEQESDRTGDTESERHGSSGMGEKVDR
ncbi:DUF6049 family protein [Streptomyces macrosporus]|uniref:DUF6049 family protein n=1 Tax=Streptomyces macrosporus TaxID=44032 RepID=A0ABN3KMM5_9ACTN